MAFENRRAIQGSSRKTKGSSRGNAREEHQEEARDRAVDVVPREPRGGRFSLPDRAHDLAVEGGAVAFLGYAFEKLVELSRDPPSRLLLARFGADGIDEPRAPSALEALAGEVHQGVDDPPGDVASDGRDQELAGGVGVLTHEDPRPQRERERHDEAEEDLGQAIAWIEVPIEDGRSQDAFFLFSFSSFLSNSLTIFSTILLIFFSNFSGFASTVSVPDPRKRSFFSFASQTSTTSVPLV